MQKHLTPLTQFLLEHFGFHLARIFCLAGFIISILSSRSINLVLLSCSFPSKAKVSTSATYRRLQRFIKEILFEERHLAKLLVKIMGIEKDEKWTIIFDRTNWKFGAVHINLLFLCVAYKNMAIPLFVINLETKKCGNSDFIDRMDLLDLFVETFGAKKVEVFLGDREFIGKKWLTYLEDLGIPYVIRIKENGQMISNSRGILTKVSELLRPLKPGILTDLGVRIIGSSGLKSHVQALRTETNELVVVIHSSDVNSPLVTYKRRWDIETMFKAFKSNGFNLEDTHVCDPDRIMTLVSILMIAFCFAYKQGELIVLDQPHLLKLKKHGYIPKSIFRVGADMIHRILCNIMEPKRKIKALFASIINLKPPQKIKIGPKSSLNQSFVM